MFVMRDMVKKQGLERSFRIDSAATSREEIGNPCYPPARRKLAKEGLSGEGHAARKMVREDYENYDYLIGMDDENLYYMYAICEGNDPYSGGWRRRDFSRERRTSGNMKSRWASYATSNRWTTRLLSTPKTRCMKPVKGSMNWRNCCGKSTSCGYRNPCC